MGKFNRKLHEYYSTQGASIGVDEDKDYYRVDLRPEDSLFRNARRFAENYRKIAAVRNGYDPSKLGALTLNDIGSGLQKIIFWAILRSQTGGLFDDFPKDAEINVCQVSDRYTAKISRIRDLMPYVGNTSSRKIKVFHGDKAAPCFRAEIGQERLSLFFRNNLSLENIAVLAKPFVGCEEVADWVAGFIDKIKRGKY